MMCVLLSKSGRPACPTSQIAVVIHILNYTVLCSMIQEKTGTICVHKSDIPSSQTMWTNHSKIKAINPALNRLLRKWISVFPHHSRGPPAHDPCHTVSLTSMPWKISSGQHDQCPQTWINRRKQNQFEETTKHIRIMQIYLVLQHLVMPQLLKEDNSSHISTTVYSQVRYSSWRERKWQSSKRHQRGFESRLTRLNLAFYCWTTS